MSSNGPSCTRRRLMTARSSPFCDSVHPPPYALLGARAPLSASVPPGALDRPVLELVLPALLGRVRRRRPRRPRDLCELPGPQSCVSSGSSRTVSYRLRFRGLTDASSDAQHHELGAGLELVPLHRRPAEPPRREPLPPPLPAPVLRNLGAADADSRSLSSVSRAHSDRASHSARDSR